MRTCIHEGRRLYPRQRALALRGLSVSATLTFFRGRNGRLRQDLAARAASPCHPGRSRERTLRNVAHCGLMPTDFTTLPHFSVSSVMNFPNSAGVIGIGTAPQSAILSFIFESARHPVISLLTLSTI